MDRVSALMAGDARALVRRIKKAKTVEEAKRIIAEFNFKKEVRLELEKSVADTFKLGHDSTGFHFEVAFDELPKVVTDWVEKRGFDAEKVANKRVTEKLNTYLQGYIKEGKTFDDYKSDIQEIYDKTGLGEYKPYHIETILRTEAQTAANYGRYVSNKDAIDVAPLWQYVFVDDDNHQEGTVCYWVANLGELIKDANWEGWKKYLPPNHFNCRSFVIAIPRSVIKKQGIVASGRYGGPQPAEGFDEVPWKM